MKKTTPDRYSRNPVEAMLARWVVELKKKERKGCSLSVVENLRKLRPRWFFKANWTKTTALAEARKYKSVREFHLNSSALAFLMRNGYQAELQAILPLKVIRRNLTRASAIKQAEKYKSPTGLQRGDPALYKFIRENRLIYKLFGRTKIHRYSISFARKALKSCRSRAEIAQKHPGLRYFLKCQGLGHLFTERFPPSRVQLNRETCLERLKNCKNRMDVKAHHGAYAWLLKNDRELLDRLFPVTEKFWTKSEEQKLRRLYKEQVSIDVIAKKLSRSNGSVTQRISVLGLHRARFGNYTITSARATLRSFDSYAELRKAGKLRAAEFLRNRMSRKDFIKFITATYGSYGEGRWP